MACQRSFTHKDLRAKRGEDVSTVSELMESRGRSEGPEGRGKYESPWGPGPTLPTPTLVWSTLWGALSAVASTLPHSAPPRSPPACTLTGILMLARHPICSLIGRNASCPQLFLPSIPQQLLPPGRANYTLAWQ